MPNRWLELHDSKVESVIIDKKDLVLTFSQAYIHESAGRPGQDKGTGWRQPIQLRFTKASLDGKPVGLPGKIDEGEFRCEGITGGGIPVPFASGKPVLLSLIFRSGNEIQIYGDRMGLVEMGAAEYVEEFPGNI